jgi:hypothetical protein
MKETKLTSPPFSLLLDKGVVRRIYEFQVRIAKGTTPTPLQIEAVKVWLMLQRLRGQLYIAQESANLPQLRPPRYANTILQNTKPLRKARYLRRWARRLRDFVFTREDAAIVATGSFGLDAETGNLGVGHIVTTDLAMVTNFNTRFAEIKDRFDQMVVNLPAPYQQAILPQVITPQTILTEW